MIFKGSEKLFTAGGDIKQFLKKSGVVYDVVDGYVASNKTFDLLHNYKIPFVVLVDGLAMGGATIYSMPGRYRVTTEQTVFAMPETAIGYFNDAGSSYFLPRLKNHFGIYLGLSGARVKGSDLLQTEISTHFVKSSQLNDLEQSLLTCETHNDVEKALQSFSSEPESSKIHEILDKTEKHFSKPTVEEILDSLRSDKSTWATETLKTLNRMSPTSLKVTLQSMLRGKNLSLRECMKMELQLAVNHHIVESDFVEGIRSVLVDKDFKPKWKPHRVEDVSDERVESFFKKSEFEDQLTFDELKNKL